MKDKKRIVLFVAGIICSLNLFSASQVSESTVGCWQRYEIKLQGTKSGNPFQDVALSASFWRDNSDTITVTGFYDGEGKYVIRFMPQQIGEWKYITKSNLLAKKITY